MISFITWEMPGQSFFKFASSPDLPSCCKLKIPLFPAEPLRRTDRKRIIRNFPDTVPNDQIEELFNDENEAHDRNDNVQPTRSSPNTGSCDQSVPGSTMNDADTNSKSPLPPASPVAGRPAPVAPREVVDFLF